MSLPSKVLGNMTIVVRQQLSRIKHQTERTILLHTVLVASAASAVFGAVLAQYFSIDVLNSLLYPPEDCWLGWPINVGRHCFNDYTFTLALGMRPNPWEPFFLYNIYPPAGMVPHLVFARVGGWLGSPRLGMFGYLLVLTVAVCTPAAWARAMINTCG